MKDKKNGIITADCCGCNNCVEKCPKKAISLQPHNLGALQAVVDTNKCIACGKCEVVCPILGFNQFNYPIATYAGLTKVPASNNSTSGGVFYIMAKMLLEANGIVYGAAYDEDLTVQHMEVSNIDELYKLQGSKYVKSSVDGCFSCVEQHLKKGKKVLFSGTPCQIAALYKYLPKSLNIDSLFTVDIICHGTPSLELFKEYIKKMEERKHAKIKTFAFRDKRYGHRHIGSIEYYKIFSKKKQTLYSSESSYYQLFLKGITYSNGCYNCPFARHERLSDITIGDFWGIKQEYPEFFKKYSLGEDESVSAVLINTNKGQSFMNEIRRNRAFICEGVEYEKIYKYNPQLNYPTKKQESIRNELSELYRKRGYEGVEEYFNTHTSWNKYTMRISSYLSSYVKAIMKKFLL